ncbi:hypothetical protein ACKGJO_09290 [Gracilimonas sp. Q87]|uniref:hypothetical protein n=1 Tax=Gracilimonas sp. Q87 TaxID=3384766 RepID=UPI0039842E08
MSLDLLSVIIGALITGIASFIGVKYQMDKTIKVEVAKLKWDRYADKLLELSEQVSKVAFLVSKNIEKNLSEFPGADNYITEVSDLFGSNRRWIHYTKLSNLLSDFEDYSAEALQSSGKLNDENKKIILDKIPTLAKDIQKEIDKIFEV